MQFDHAKEEINKIAAAFGELPELKGLTYDVSQAYARSTGEAIRKQLGMESTASGAPDINHYRIAPRDFEASELSPAAAIETMHGIIQDAIVKGRKENDDFSIGSTTGLDHKQKPYIAIFPSKDGKTESTDTAITQEDVRALSKEVKENIGFLRQVQELSAESKLPWEEQASPIDRIIESHLAGLDGGQRTHVYAALAASKADRVHKVADLSEPEKRAFSAIVKDTSRFEAEAVPSR